MSTGTNLMTIQERAANIMKCFGGDNNIEKSLQGEGSKGGKVIGHTKSGKPIYENVNPTGNTHHYKKFSKQDHLDAAEHHAKLSAKDKEHKDQEKRRISKLHNLIYDRHMEQADKLSEAKKKIIIDSPMASHGSLHGKIFEVQKESVHKFASGDKKYYHIKDEDGDEHEISEDFVKKDKKK